MSKDRIYIDLQHIVETWQKHPYYSETSLEYKGRKFTITVKEDSAHPKEGKE